MLDAFERSHHHSIRSIEDNFIGIGVVVDVLVGSPLGEI